MHYLCSITGNAWFDNFVDQATPGKGYGVFTDYVTGNTVLVTHANAEGRLPCIERDQRWELVNQAHLIVCCYPGAVKKTHPHLPIIGDWLEPTWVTVKGLSEYTGGHLVELMSDTENAKYYK